MRLEKEGPAFNDDLNVVGFVASDFVVLDNDDNDKDPNSETISNTDDCIYDVMDRDNGTYNSDGTNDDIN